MWTLPKYFKFRRKKKLKFCNIFKILEGLETLKFGGGSAPPQSVSSFLRE
jgi:hypothetical protein